MNISISSSPAVATPIENFANVQAPSRPQPTTKQAPDTVTLTAAQQVYQLYNQGQDISQIALSLRLSVEAVNTYLGNTASSS